MVTEVECKPVRESLIRHVQSMRCWVCGVGLEPARAPVKLPGRLTMRVFGECRQCGLSRVMCEQDFQTED